MPDLAAEAIQKTVERGPEIMGGSGLGATLVAWLSNNPTLVTSITGLVGMFCAIGGLVWMIYRDTRKMRNGNE